MNLKVRRIGNSLGVVLPRETLEKLGVGEGDELVVTTPAPGHIDLAPADPDIERQMEIARRGMKRYRNALRELAK